MNLATFQGLQDALLNDSRYMERKNYEHAIGYVEDLMAQLDELEGWTPAMEMQEPQRLALKQLFGEVVTPVTYVKARALVARFLLDFGYANLAIHNHTPKFWETRVMRIEEMAAAADDPETLPSLEMYLREELMFDGRKAPEVEAQYLAGTLTIKELFELKPGSLLLA